MPAGYRLFYVTTWSTLPGKGAEARDWYDQARKLWSRFPGVRSIEAFAAQFGLAPASDQIEIWIEIDDYAVLDRWDEATPEFADEFIALTNLAAGSVRQESARLVGDWVGSTIQDLAGAD